VFKKPVGDSNLLKHLNDLSDDSLTVEFVQKRDEFLAHILTHSRVKSIHSQRVTGRGLASLTESYVASIAGGKISVESAVQRMVRDEAGKATNEGLQLYLQLMEMKVPMFPTDNAEELAKAHDEAVVQAMELFNSRCVADCDSKYAEDFCAKLEESYQDECKQNESKSRERCEQLLQELYRDIDSKTTNRYLCAGGYSDYLDDMENLKDEYCKKQHKGIMAEVVLAEFVANQRLTSERLLQADLQMTEDLVTLNDEFDRKDEVDREQRELEESRRRTEELIESRRQEFQQQIAAMTAQHEEDMRHADEEERIRLENGLQDLERRLKETFEEEMRPLRAQFEGLVAENRHLSEERTRQQLMRQQSYNQKLAELDRELSELRANKGK
jgi:membrane-bound lytic murein transglycosylase